MCVMLNEKEMILDIGVSILNACALLTVLKKIRMPQLGGGAIGHPFTYYEPVRMKTVHFHFLYGVEKGTSRVGKPTAFNFRCLCL